MNGKLAKIVGATLVALSINALVPSFAMAFPYRFYANPYAYRPYYGYNPYFNPYSVFMRHPILSRTLVGTAVGAAGGAAVGAITSGGHYNRGRHIAHSAAVGAGVGSALGLGLGVIRNYQYRRYFW